MCLIMNALPIASRSCIENGSIRVMISCRMIPKLYTSPFFVPFEGGLLIRKISGAVQRRPRYMKTIPFYLQNKKYKHKYNELTSCGRFKKNALLFQDLEIEQLLRQLTLRVSLKMVVWNLIKIFIFFVEMEGDTWDSMRLRNFFGQEIHILIVHEFCWW